MQTEINKYYYIPSDVDVISIPHDLVLMIVSLIQLLVLIVVAVFFVVVGRTILKMGSSKT